ncbi:MAG: alpha/beta fold hydrolase [Phycisphaeraceae bacterium]|nr:alpha/beta fold hydrolase [Phycisphaeraceae bacterium]
MSPMPPPPYCEDEVRCTNAGVTLAGTLSLPTDGTPRPAVVLISGSGAMDRDSAAFGHRSFFVLADHLARQGIAVLRTDSRGVGKSTGSAQASTLRDRAADTLALLRFLQSHRGIDPDRIGLIGHSEGTLVGALTAAQSEVGFLVLMAGPGQPLASVFLAQGSLLLRGAGATEEFIARFTHKERRLFALLAAEPDDAAARRKLVEIESGWQETLTPQEKRWLTAILRPSADQWLSPWFRDLCSFDPRPVLGQVRCPVLVLACELDRMASPSEALASIGQALHAGGNRDHELRLLSGLNHWLRPGKTGMWDECKEPGPTIAPAVLELIGEWIGRQACRSRSCQ